MRSRRLSVVFCTTLGLAVLAGCTLLTDIPDDAASGSPDAGHGRTDASSGVDASNDVQGSETTDAKSNDAPGDLPDGDQPSVVAFDAIGPSPSGTGGVNKTSPLVFSHTTKGVNRALFVAVIIGNDPDSAVNVSGVTYDDVPFTLMKIQHSNDKDAGYVSLWVLTNPSEGMHSVSVAFTGSPQVITAGSISFTGVDQQTPYQNLTSLGGDGATAKVSVTSATGNMVVTALSSGCTIENSAQSFGWYRNEDCNNAGDNGAQSATAGAPTVKLSYSVAADWWGMIAADVRAAGSH